MDSESIQQPISGVSHSNFFLIIFISQTFLIITIVLFTLFYHILLNSNKFNAI